MNMTFTRSGAYEVFDPYEGGVFGYLNIVAQEGEECILLEPGEHSESLPMTGDFAAALGSPGSPLQVTFSPSIDGAAGFGEYGIFLGTHVLSMEGSMGMALTGENAGKILGAA